MLAVAEAALFEPVLHGSQTSLDEVLDRWGEAIVEVLDPEGSFGETKSAQEGMKAAEAMFPQAEPLEPTIDP